MQEMHNKVIFCPLTASVPEGTSTHTGEQNPTAECHQQEKGGTCTPIKGAGREGKQDVKHQGNQEIDKHNKHNSSKKRIHKNTERVRSNNKMSKNTIKGKV